MQVSNFILRAYFNDRAAIWDETVAEKDVTRLAQMANCLELEPGATVKISFPVQSNQSGSSDPGGGGGGGSSSLWVGLVGLAFLGGAGWMVYNMMRPRRTLRW